MEDEIWGTLHRHLKSVFERDSETYVATTSEDLSLFEWFVTPHRQDGLDFHRFMIDHSWAGRAIIATICSNRGCNCTATRPSSVTRSCSAAPNRKAAWNIVRTTKAAC